ncbi:MAG: tetratricopeptide repeat protein, partial [Vicinamibacteria bacterium]
YQAGHPAEAIVPFERVLALAGPDVTLLNALGACHAAGGDDARAVEYLQKSLELAPDQESVRALLQKIQAQPDPNR